MASLDEVSLGVSQALGFENTLVIPSVPLCLVNQDVSPQLFLMLCLHFPLLPQTLTF